MTDYGLGSEETKHIETIEKLEVPSYAATVDTRGIDEAKLIRKIDWALIPWFAVCSFK
jgi:hypothetical protein